MKRKEAEEVPGLQMSKAKMSRSKENNNSADEKSKKYDRQLRYEQLKSFSKVLLAG